ncbi:MAG: putative Ig domain-containing protein [Thermodesulfobacteriota bacterium]|nr:putative Ig domain-containing protein [Thermodesulfobacteriota bacterium]
MVRPTMSHLSEIFTCRRSFFRSPAVVMLALLVFLFPQTAHAVVNVTLAWNPNGEEDLAGYRVYHREEGQSFNYSTPAWEGTETTCTIEDLDDTVTHYFVAKAFDLAGNESDDSVEEMFIPNRPPVLDTIGSKSGQEGQTLQFTISASDPDNDDLTYTAGNVPTGASFDGVTQTFTWTPDYAASGNYTVTFTVTDNGTPVKNDSEDVLITISNVNRSPVLDAIGAKGVDEGQLLQFTIAGSDPDNDALTYAAENVPSGGSFDGATRTFTWTPDYNASGDHTVTFTVTDDGSPVKTDSEEVTITVSNVNRPPVLVTIGAKSVDEGQELTFAVTASDPDNDALAYSAGNVPTGSSFNETTQTFTWTPDYGDAGNYIVTFTVTDSGTPIQSDSEDVTITVGNVNRPPVLNAIGAKSVDEGQALTFTVTGSDPDNDALAYSAGNVPTGASFDEMTQTFTWTPDYGDAGNYIVTFTVTDSGTPVQSDSEDVTITVGDVNRPPVLNAIGAKSVDEGQELTFTVTGSDPDNDALAYSAGNVPTGASFDEVTQTFTWTPDYGDAGNYIVTFTVTDSGTPVQSDSEDVTITVGDVNRPPVLNAIGAKSVDEGQELTFTVTGSDPDNDALTYSAGNVPTGASFDEMTQTFTWTPDYGDGGNYIVTFTVTDSGTPIQSDSEDVTITVGDVNRPPVLNAIGAKSVDEGQELTFTVTGSDPDNDALTYSAGNVPTGASFDEMTQTFTWTPDYGDGGNYIVTFTVTDSGTPIQSDSEDVTITVGNVNRPPVLTTIGARSIDEGQALTFTVTGSDPDNDGLTYSADNVPTGASFDEATQTFTWTPEYGVAGDFVVTFTVTDDGTPVQSDSEDVTITVSPDTVPPSAPQGFGISSSS